MEDKRVHSYAAAENQLGRREDPVRIGAIDRVSVPEEIAIAAATEAFEGLDEVLDRAEEVSRRGYTKKSNRTS